MHALRDLSAQSTEMLFKIGFLILGHRDKSLSFFDDADVVECTIGISYRLT